MSSETENRIVTSLGRILERVGELLIIDDYEDYKNRNLPYPKDKEAKRLIPNYPLHHYQYGDLLRYIGQEIQKESNKKD